jgi:hypothetical protein
MPYAVGELVDLDSLIRAHSDFQTQALSAGSTIDNPPAVLVEAREDIGIGNRLPSIATAFVMALFTGRLLLVDAKAVLQHIDLPLPADWHQHKSRYGRHDCIPVVRSSSTVMHLCVHSSNSINSTATGNTTGLNVSDATLLKYRSMDYDMPILQVNPQLSELFNKFFPDGEVFHAVAKYLYKPAAIVTAGMQPYFQRARDCIVGLQMRHKKPYDGQQVQADHFASIARMLAKRQVGTMFLASDADVFSHMQQLLGPLLWWSSLTSTSVGSRNTTAGNPGTETSAFVDIFLLTKCKAIVVSPASSFGIVAAGIAGVKAVFATYGRHEVPFLNTWFWQSVTSEPCMFKASKSHGFGGAIQARLKASYELYLYHTQCHY